MQIIYTVETGLGTPHPHTCAYCSSWEQAYKILCEVVPMYPNAFIYEYTMDVALHTL